MTREGPIRDGECDGTALSSSEALVPSNIRTSQRGYPRDEVTVACFAPAQHKDSFVKRLSSGKKRLFQRRPLNPRGYCPRRGAACAQHAAGAGTGRRTPIRKCGPRRHTGGAHVLVPDPSHRHSVMP
jgi:hypothetical protein